MNELLFANYGINYNNEPLIYRKGTLMIKVFKFVLLLYCCCFTYIC